MSEIKLKKLVEISIETGQFSFSAHAEQRLNERDVTIQEIKQTMKSGHHEKKKDVYRREFDSWNYAWRGKTLDGRNLRIIFYLEDGIIFVTIIDLDIRG